MKTTDLPRFVKLIEAMAAASGKQITESSLFAYEIGLQDVPIEDIERAVVTAIRESKFLASPAELREFAGHGKSVSTESTGHAFQDLERLANECANSGGKSVTTRNEALNKTIGYFGGLRVIAMKPIDEFHTWFRREFERVYASFAADFPEESTTHVFRLSERASKQIASPKPIGELLEGSSLTARIEKCANSTTEGTTK